MRSNPNSVKHNYSGPCQKIPMATPPMKAIPAVVWRSKLLKFPKGYSRELIIPSELRIWESQLRKEECSSEDQVQLMESNGSSLNDAMDSVKAGMQVDQGGDVPLPPC